MHSSSSAANLILVGPPNSGKTTLFNRLTHSRYRAVNYPGSTVDCLRGRSDARFGSPIGVIDTPGIYGLNAESPDEEITIKILRGDRNLGELYGAVVCVDSTQLERHLALALRIKSLGWPIVVALTMTDLAEKSGIHIDIALLKEHLGCEVIAFRGFSGVGADEIVIAARRFLAPFAVAPLSEMGLAQAQKKSREIASKVQRRDPRTVTPIQKTRAIDRWALHPFFGLLAFFVIMVSVFSAVFWLADPLMGAVEEAFGWLGQSIHQFFGATLFADFLADGIVASVAAVVVFAPQIFILFLLMGFLEDSGYLARAATLIDRPLSLLGLSGRSFVPMLSGYACAVPAIMAARTIRSAKERWLAVFVIPLLSCSARLPVYALLLGFLFWGQPAWQAGLALAGIYLLSLVVGGLAAALLSRLVKGFNDTTFLIELPMYRRPQFKAVIQHALGRTWSYVRRAGPVIFVLALVLWVGTTFPRAEPDVTGSQAVAQSYMGQLGQKIEPLFTPLGVDWRVGVGLLSAFAAREVFVSALALVFDVTLDGEDETIRTALIEKMQQAELSDGTKVFTTGSVIGLILFFMIALQCTSTTAVAAREMGSWRFALVQLLALNVVAYILAATVVAVMS